MTTFTSDDREEAYKVIDESKQHRIDKLKKGIERKMKLFRENPNNQSVNKQVELLNQTIEAYKYMIKIPNFLGFFIDILYLY